MRSSHRRRVGLTLALSTAMLTGCGATTDVISPVPSGSTDAPTSEEVVTAWPEARNPDLPQVVEQVATAAVSQYLERTDAITRGGGVDATAMAELTTPEWFVTERLAFDRYRTERLRTVGTTLFHSLVVQALWEGPEGGVEVDVVVCVDATGVWLLPARAPDPPEGLMDWVESDSTVFEGDEDQWTEWTEYLDDYLPQPGVNEAVVIWLVGSDLSTLRIDGTANWEGGHSCGVELE